MFCVCVCFCVCVYVCVGGGLIIIISSMSMKAVFFASHPGVNHPSYNPCICSTTLHFIGHLRAEAMIRGEMGVCVYAHACVCVCEDGRCYAVLVCVITALSAEPKLSRVQLNSAQHQC